MGGGGGGGGDTTGFDFLFGVKLNKRLKNSRDVSDFEQCHGINRPWTDIQPQEYIHVI